MALADRFRPKTLESTRVSQAIKMGLRNPPHIIFHGGPGSGKYTVANLWIKRSFAAEDDFEPLKKKEWTFKSPTKLMTSNVWSCKTHFIVNPSLLGTNDRYFLQNFVESVCDTANVSSYNDAGRQGSDYKVILIINADLLSSAAQHSIKCIMETSVHNCRFVLLTRSLSKLIDAISSRCIKVKVVSETGAMMSTLRQVETEIFGGDSPISETSRTELIQNTKGNWKTFWLLVSVALDSAQLQVEALVKTRSEELLAEEVIALLLKSPTIDSFLVARDKMYSMLNLGLTPSVICCELTVASLSRLANLLTAKQIDSLLRIACLTDVRASCGRPIVHLEWFVASVLELCVK